MGPGRATDARRGARAGLPVIALAILLAAAGCGDEEDPTSGDPFGEGDAALTVTLDPDGPDGQEEELSEEVNCEEASDDAPCLAVQDLETSDLDPAPADQPCTEIFGGPDVATVEGEVNGEDINAELNRSNGCEIERFDRAVPLLQALFEGYEPGAAINKPAPG